MAVITEAHCISQTQQENKKLLHAIKENPFYNEVTLTSSQWLQTFSLGLILVPTRLLLISLLLVFIWLPCCVVMSVTSLADEVTPLERDCVMWFMWALYKVSGLNVIMEGRPFLVSLLQNNFVRWSTLDYFYSFTNITIWKFPSWHWLELEGSQKSDEK